MAENSKIEWTDHTFNPWIGCQKVSPGCDHCYAERDNARWKWTAGGEWGPHAERRRTSEANWKKPRQWAKAANGHRPRVFCASLADVFDNQVPPEWRSDLYDLIAATPELDWLLLTKRPENFARMLPTGKWENLWLGVTCENQEQANRRIPLLLATTAPRIRFLSCEPMLGEIDLYTPHAHWATHPNNTGTNATLVDWVICGGESGHDARMMQEWWAAQLMEQCNVGKIAFFMKQMTGKKPIPADLMVRQFPDVGLHQ